MTRTAAGGGRDTMETERRPTKVEWIAAYLTGLERSGYTGHVALRVTYNNGSIVWAAPLLEEKAGT
jgi:hypothetical protein